MNESDKFQPRCTAAVFDPDAVCDECGAFGAFEFEGRRLCTDCYAGKGSCCPEFGQDDLWRFEQDVPHPAR